MAASPCTESPSPLHWDGTTLRILDQTRLPAEEVVLELHGTPDTVEAIKRLAVRGAPMIGIAAAYGLAMELARDETPEALERAAALMAGARPTARNLAWRSSGSPPPRSPRPGGWPTPPARPPSRSSARTRPPAPRSPGTAPRRSTRSCPTGRW